MCYIKLFRKNLALLKTEGRWVGYEAVMNFEFFFQMCLGYLVAAIIFLQRAHMAFIHEFI